MEVGEKVNAAARRAAAERWLAAVCVSAETTELTRSSRAINRLWLLCRKGRRERGGEVDEEEEEGRKGRCGRG